MPTALLCVSGLRSPEDEARVERALTRARGVLAAVASREAACAEVDFDDDETTTDELLAILRAEGFEARLGG
ncbi:MAG TPA: hypothetical protein VIL18_01480 [Longimicrobiales bacterium]|jgi:copper chaperone CopZ